MIPHAFKDSSLVGKIYQRLGCAESRAKQAEQYLGVDAIHGTGVDAGGILRSDVTSSNVGRPSS